ncbi:MAG TPA: hypothetical protein VLI46_13860 [Ramlibacter sp.]|nr:hypothetical protein [Ramlibacter sp.]
MRSVFDPGALVIQRHACAAALVVAAGLGGCAADRVSGVPPAAAAAAPVMGAPSNCRFNIEAVEDLREGVDLGSMGRTRIGGEHFRGWFNDGILAIPGHSVQPAPIKIRIEVSKAYIQALHSLKSANIVVKVRLTSVQGTSTQKMYRGVNASLNWSSSESEVQAAFDGALADLRRQVGADLSALCSG